LNTPRTRTATEVQAALQGLGASVSAYGSVDAALEAQCERATPEDEILLFGSFYCVAQALEWLERRAMEEAANGYAG
jgi:dihydrofolate synthase/folylpolyglutamate synthase